MDVNVWSKVKVDVQTATEPPKVITSISKASPAVVGCTGHGFAAGDIVLFKVTGMRELNYRPVRVLASVTADTFSLEGIDSTTFDTFVSGTVERVDLGATASTFQDVNSSGGEAAAILISTIHEDQDYEIPGNRSPLNMSFGSLWIPSDPALLALKELDDSKTAGVVMLTFATGAKILYACHPSVTLAPTGSSGNAVTTPVTFRVRGRLTTYAS